MKRRIVVEYGEVNKIAELIGCTNVMVSHALARSIRKLALERGGTEIGVDTQKSDCDEKRPA